MLPLVKSNWSDANFSVPPPPLVKTYLSSSNGKNTSLEPESTERTLEELLLIVTSNSFLIIIEESAKSTDSMFLLGRGEKILSSLSVLSVSVVKMVRSLTEIAL